MSRPRAVTLGWVVALAAGGCGTPSADLLVVERSGEVPGARLTLRMQDGAEATCNGDKRGTMTSDQLIEARAIVRALRGKPEKQEPGLQATAPRLPARPGSIFSFAARWEEGTVRFADNARGLPAAYSRLIKLTRDVARGVCGLER